MVFQVVFSGDLGNMILALIILMSFIPGENEEIEDNDYILEITIEKDFDLFLAQYLDKDQTSLVVQIISFYTKLAYYGNPTIKRFIESGIVSASILNFQRNCEVLSREIFNFLKVLTISADDVFEPLVNVIFSFDFADIAEVTPFFIREKIVKFVLHMASISGPFFTKMILSPKMIDFLIQFSECCDSSKQEKIILCLSNILRGSGDPEFVQMVVLKWDESVSLTCICPDLLNPEIVL
ncbi:hypothetical protein GPJ56_008942 [Histomonas meleagridis]|uniref:uncharacterized protein n=1 Tax=Histomonas meleagridis TaxID=135588 RepID=UPI00355A8A7C|nr:hypothetical protein GPJ56_008942 [Histomonas meleagridis]KAH0805703.1 hypothetical protein GO595_001544 [Histomonas meleagridis]